MWKSFAGLICRDGNSRAHGLVVKVLDNFYYSMTFPIVNAQ